MELSEFPLPFHGYPLLSPLTTLPCSPPSLMTYIFFHPIFFSGQSKISAIFFFRSETGPCDRPLSNLNGFLKYRETSSKQLHAGPLFPVSPLVLSDLSLQQRDKRVLAGEKRNWLVSRGIAAQTLLRSVSFARQCAHYETRASVAKRNKISAAQPSSLRPKPVR